MRTISRNQIGAAFAEFVLQVLVRMSLVTAGFNILRNIPLVFSPHFEMAQVSGPRDFVLNKDFI